MFESEKRIKKKLVKCRSVQVMLNDRERQAIEILAEREGMNMSELVRLAVREFAKARGVTNIGLIDLIYMDMKGEALK